MEDTYLVTGATGFVGSHIVRELVRRHASVHIFVRNKTLNWRLADIASKIHIHETDLLSPGLPDAVADIRPTVIYHTAAYGAMPKEISADTLVDVNIKGTLNLIKAVQHHPIRLLVNTGSSSEYGVKDTSMKETDTLKPVNEYGVTKAAATMFTTMLARRENLPVITLRLFSPYGPYEGGGRFVPSVILGMLAHTPMEFSSPDYVRDFVYIGDVVDAYLTAALKPPAPGTVINIGSGREHRLGYVVDVARKLTGSQAPVTWNPAKTQARQKEPDHWQADISLAEELLGWKPSHTLEQGISKTVEWFRKHTDRKYSLVE